MREPAACRLPFSSALDMTKFIIRRFLGLIPTLFIIVTLSFFIIRVAPGGPFSSETERSRSRCSRTS